MTRKSSIHFKPVTNVRFAVSHSERTDLSEPGYLLPKEHQLANIVVAGSLSENDLSALFIKQKEGMTGQARARGSSPFWEGVVVLPNTDSQEQSSNLQAWKKAYEKETGHKVLHMSVHLDEGYLDVLGKPQYNPHAHVMVSRMDEKSRVISLDRKQLAKVQDLTAEQLKMERGSTLAERQGKRGRAHVPHREFRTQANENRLELDKQKEYSKLYSNLLDSQRVLLKDKQQWLRDAQLEANKVPKLEAEIAHFKLEIDGLNRQYRLDREAMKASGKAKQADYQNLKKERDDALAKIAQLGERVSELTGYTGKLEAAMVAAGERSQTLTDKLEAKTKEHDAFKAHAEQMVLEASKRAQESPEQPKAPKLLLKPEKSLTEAFLELYGHIKTVLVGLIDGMRLDAAEGRLGLFSSHCSTGPRVQVLCEVPEDKVMPVVGQCFDSRARPGKGGIGD